MWKPCDFLHIVLSSENFGNFTFCLLILMFFISISYLTSMAGTFNNMLNKSVENGYPCLLLFFYFYFFIYFSFIGFKGKIVSL